MWSRGRNGIGRSDEIGRVYSEFGGELWRAMLVVVGGRGDLADEVVAEAFSRLLARWDNVRSPRPWLYRTAYRLAVDELRRTRRDESAAIEDIPASDRHQLLSDDLIVLLKALSPEQRLTVFLHYQADLSIADTAELTGATVATVRVRLHRARRVLRRRLEEETHV